MSWDTGWCTAVHISPNQSYSRPEVHSAIESVSAFAPLHIQAELEGVRIVEQLLGDVPQVAVFDTGFHQQMPAEAAIYPGPYDWFKRGIRRYGFHGINHQYCADRAGQLMGGMSKLSSW